MLRPRLALRHALPAGLPVLALSLVALGVACSSVNREGGFGEPAEETPDASDLPEGAVTERPQEFTETDASVVGDAAVIACAPNPEFAEIPGNNCDDDGDGQVDNVAACDVGLAKDGTAAALAKALGLCHAATPTADWGLVSAEVTRGYGRTDLPKPEQGGVLPKFGNVLKPREGERLAVLSTGYADEFNGAPSAAFGGNSGTLQEPQFNGKDWWNAANGPAGGTGKLPPGFPKPAQGCGQNTRTNDVINLKLTLKAPKNAKGFSFDFNFHSGEWPAYVCSEFNDGFLAYLTAKGFNGGTSDNISFDAMGNPVSVNNGFFDRCTTGVSVVGCAGDIFTGNGKNSNCAAGTAELEGTGFGQVGTWCKGVIANGPNSTNGGATGWLTTSAPVEAGETFTLELMIWDTGDALLDSSVLLDNFRWIASEVTVGTARPR